MSLLQWMCVTREFAKSLNIFREFTNSLIISQFAISLKLFMDFANSLISSAVVCVNLGHWLVIFSQGREDIPGPSQKNKTMPRTSSRQPTCSLPPLTPSLYGTSWQGEKFTVSLLILAAIYFGEICCQHILTAIWICWV